MSRVRFFATWTMALALGLMMNQTKRVDADQLYEVRHYVLGESGDESALDAYLKDALIPALDRQGIGPVGAFAYPESLNPADQGRLAARVVLVIPYDSAESIAKTAAAIQADDGYQTAGKDYLNRAHNVRAYARIESELLVAMDCMKTLNVPEGTLENDDRVYELRLYESANERLGHLKVDMFNNGEVPIFLDSGIQPVFIGQCLVGPQQPSLTYLTVYPSNDARNESWDKFRAHPDWDVLSKDPKYANTVSRINKLVMTAKPYSKM